MKIKDISRLIQEMDLIQDQMKDMRLKYPSYQGDEWEERGSWAENMKEDLNHLRDIQFSNELMKALELNPQERSILNSHFPDEKDDLDLNKVVLSGNLDNAREDLEDKYKSLLNDLGDEYIQNDALIIGGIINKFDIQIRIGGLDHLY